MSKPRTVKLFCPSLSKLVQFVAWDEQRLDLGSIARTCGLDPSTVKLNGHYISRGVDLVSSSVTWRSLLKFFSAKGLSTGKDDKDALIVDGKVCKVGSKRPHESQESLDGIPDKVLSKDIGTIQRPSSEDINLLKNKRPRDSSSECEERGHQYMSISNGIGFKRKHLLEDVGLLKKSRINEFDADFVRKGRNYSSNIPKTHFKCSYLSANMKRPREDEEITATNCKRIR